jgi:hypothetical protein
MESVSLILSRPSLRHIFLTNSLIAENCRSIRLNSSILATIGKMTITMNEKSFLEIISGPDKANERQQMTEK